MSQPTLPPLDWAASMPAEDNPRAERPVAHANPDSFVWPTPPFAAYPSPVASTTPDPVEVTAANGSRSVGQLLRFLPVQRQVHLLMPPAKNAIVVHLNQLAALKLIRPIKASQQTENLGDESIPLDIRPRIEFRVMLRNGKELKGQTIGHAQDDLGLFLFVPMSPSDDAVQRLFVPREAVDQVDFGERIGELLLADSVVTPEQVASAANEQANLRNRKVGDILLANHVVSPDQLLEAIQAQSRMPIVRIGEALVALDLITPQQLQDALNQQKEDRSVPLGELLVRKKVVTRAQLQSALARKMGYPLVDVDTFPAEPEAARRLALNVAMRLEVLPLIQRDGVLVVAMEDPTRRDAIDEVEFISQLKVVPALARVGTVGLAINVAYERAGLAGAVSSKHDPSQPLNLDFEPGLTGKLMESLEREVLERPDDRDDKPIEQSDNSLVKLINNMITEAQAKGVSDIHIECQPGKDKVRVRFRKDGVMAPHLELPPSYRSALVARIKVMCDLDISEKRKPQDGKINFSKFASGNKLELRVATIPTSNGLEDVVMRLLASAKPIAMEKLGLTKPNFEQLAEAIERPYGMVLCVGPTGSGKTTTLHSVLGRINTPERKIWTAEDPVEITQAGLRQVQVNPKIDWTFAKALRAFLRADPDVIMVGEIRDQETAEIAIEASLTGHLVLSTLHTNSAPETITRLLDMGADPFNFGDSLLAVLAQRLVRRLCSHCRQEVPMPVAERDELIDDYLHLLPKEERPSRQDILGDWLTHYAPKGQVLKYHSPGCTHCENSGFKGRAGLHELLVVSREVRQAIQSGQRAEEIQRIGLSQGMRTLRQDGILKVLQGVTSLAEVRATSNA
jgi:type II secretory ATPase GspE/PulE/Tfp pilus assembly ATPase PilB-like protein